MPMYYVPTNTGYCGTDEVMEIEADSGAEAEAEAWDILCENLHVGNAEEIQEND